MFPGGMRDRLHHPFLARQNLGHLLGTEAVLGGREVAERAADKPGLVVVHGRELGNELVNERRGIPGKDAAALAGLVPAPPRPRNFERDSEVERRGVGRIRLEP
jgi:hypothetical protein